MQVVFESRDGAASPWRATAERRLRFVLRRLGWLVPMARIRMDDINGPRGGVDKRCQVELRTAGLGPVVVTAVSRHWRDALDRALARAAKVLLRHWRRAHRHGAAAGVPA